MTFGQWIKTQRIDRRLDQTECAARAGITIQRWSQIEGDESRRKNGEPPQVTRKTCERVARGLDIPLSEVLRVAGYAPDRDDADDGPAWEAYYDELPPSERQEIDEYVEFKYRRWLDQGLRGKKAE